MDLSNENIIHVKKEGYEYIQFRKLLEYENEVKHIIPIGKNLNFRTSSEANPVSQENYEKTMRDYDMFAKEIGGERKDIIKSRLNHTANVERVLKKFNKDKEDIGPGIYNDTDGLVTDKKEVILVSTTADCLTLIFYDTKNKVIANIHSGWKGTVGRISMNAINKMKEEFDSKPEDIICCMCPSIRKCHFEVKEDVRNIFEKEFKDIFEQIEEGKINYSKEDIIEEVPETQSWYIDTVLINKIMMLNVGLKEENIIDSKICTVCNSDIMNSYRAHKKGFGVNTVMIKLV